MEDFGLDHPELSGNVFTLEFGSGGRIQQLWAADPNVPDGAHEYAFVIGPVSFGEEFAEDYFPGTVLLGARTRPDEPWILDRNKSAQNLGDDGRRSATFEYEFPLLSELRVSGKFFETLQPIPRVVWELQVANRGRVSVEVGELAFPMAFNNLFESEQGGDERRIDLLRDRLRLHPFIGASASFLYAQRLSGEAPGLLVFPGESTRWEFFASVPASLQSPLRWPGIPVAYVYSRAALEREGWPDWMGESTSIVLEPGDSRVYETVFAPTPADPLDAVQGTLSLCRMPSFRLWPAAVLPRDVEATIGIGGIELERVLPGIDAAVHTESFESGAMCQVRANESGPCRLGILEKSKRMSYLELFFVEPIRNLITARAAWIAARQQACKPEARREPSSPSLHGAILPMNLATGGLCDSGEGLASGFSVVCGLCDALFLAEKNAHYPNAFEMEALGRFLEEFLWDDLQNPADGAVGAGFEEGGDLAFHFGNTRAYVLVSLLHDSLYRASRLAGSSPLRPPRDHLVEAHRTCRALFRNALGSGVPPGVLGISMLADIAHDLRRESMDEHAAELDDMLDRRAADVCRRVATNPATWAWNAAAFEEAYWSAKRAGASDLVESVLGEGFAQRAPVPSWWSYGSEARVPDVYESSGNPAFADRGGLYLGGATTPLSLLFLDWCSVDRPYVPESYARLAFGGMMAPWALVRSDGAASMGFCPDCASKHHGASVWTGDLGLSLFYYLRGARSLVFPSRHLGMLAFGCEFSSEADGYRVTPWDGVGRRISLRQIAFDCSVDFGSITTLELDRRKRWARIELANPAHHEACATLAVGGLWGAKLEANGKSVQAVEGRASFPVTLPGADTAWIEVRVVN